MSGDENVYYKQLVEEFSDTVTRLCVLHTGNWSEAEDCYQNTFFKLFKQLKKGDIPNPKAWLIRVTLNECRSALRYKLSKSAVCLDDVTAVCEDEREHEMLDLIYRLPPKNRDAIYLYYYEEMSVEEIAKATKTKVNTVKSQLKRGREKLKGFLEN